MNQRIALRLLAAPLTATLLLISSCGGSTAPATQAAAPPPDPGDPMEIKATGNLLSRVKTGEAGFATVGATITVAARVEVDDTRLTRVGSPIMGRIVSLAAHHGEPVRNGQTLATLQSTGLSDAQLSFLKRLSEKQVAQRAVDRAQALLKADVIGSVELQRREAELTQASAELDAARDQLVLLGMPQEAVEELQRTRAMNSISRIVSNLDGIVMERKVTAGQVVQPADTIYEIADLSHVWLVADVPEQSSGHLSKGQAVEAKISALPGRIIHGRLSFVSATVNPETRTVQVRMDVPNADRRLKPAMLATMDLKDHTEKQQVVPLSSVVREGNAECVFVERAPGTFHLREVKLGPEYGGQRVLLEGIKPGERIVVDGAFHLNNERRRRNVRGSEG